MYTIRLPKEIWNNIIDYAKPEITDSKWIKCIGTKTYYNLDHVYNIEFKNSNCLSLTFVSFPQPKFFHVTDDDMHNVIRYLKLEKQYEIINNK